MPHYQQRGVIPHKRHTQYRKADGSLYAEQLFSTKGFSSDYSLLYHCHPPTVMVRTGKPADLTPKAGSHVELQHMAFNGFALASHNDYLSGRTALLFNNDCIISLAAPSKGFEDYFYKNADCDEIIFIHEGSGKLKTCYGEINYGYGDYLVIPRGTIYQLIFDTDYNRLLIVESSSPVRYPKRYLSECGQMLEHSPFCERDIRVPEILSTIDEKGEFLVQTKKNNFLYPICYGYHPFDVIGWDGCCYPFALSIFDFEPITGRLHQPPPVHQTFETDNFVVCSFVPRLYDYHPGAIPAPYNHSNIDSDEVLYYVDGDFMSRKTVTRGMISLHPAGIPHGPHPGTVEKSIGAKETKELAVMVDTFRPINITEDALLLEQKGYALSWAE